MMLTARSKPAQEPPGSSPADHAEVAFHPPLLLVLGLLVGFGARWIAALEWVPGALAAVAGPLVAALALAWFSWAVYTMRAQGASIPTGEPTGTIVRRWPYRFSRNPIYVAMLLLQVGVAIWANSLWFICLAAI